MENKKHWKSDNKIDLKELFEIIKETGYKIQTTNVRYSLKYDVPHYVYLKILSPEYNEAVLNDDTISENKKKFFLDR